MDIYPASWAILNKIESKHGIRWAEVNEVFGGRPRIRRILARDQYGQNRYKALGTTGSGRYLTVVFVREHPEALKVITARPMDMAEKREFKRK